MCASAAPPCIQSRMRTSFDLAYFSTSWRSRPSTPLVGSAPLYGTIGPPYQAVLPTPSSEWYGTPASAQKSM